MKTPFPRKVWGCQLRRAFVLSLLTTVVVTSLGCQSQAIRTDAPVTEARNANDLMVVDCRLPGQIRKLGQSFTFVAPRRAIKTAATDCEIRGGEYVAYDRANYATALKIWLPEAKAGDPEAMVYVGEIYEKGLGVVADYELAHLWYRKAAELGNTRAQINLGYLYESGLGTDRDLTTAMNWYRRASGLSDGELEFVSSVEHAQRQAVTEELGTLRKQSRELRDRLAAAEAKLKQNRRSLAATRQEATALRRELAVAPSVVKATQPAAPAKPDPAVTRELERAKAEQRRLLTELSDQQRESAQLRRELDANQTLLAGERRKLADLHVELVDAQTKSKAASMPTVAPETSAERALREDMQSLTQRLETNRDEIARLTGLLAASDTRNHTLQAQLASRDQEVDAIQDQLAAAVEMDGELANMQAMLGVSQQERRRLADELALVELRAAESEAALAKARQDLDLRQDALAAAEKTVEQMRQKLDARRRGDVVATTAQIEELGAAVAQREQLLAKARTQVKSLQRSLADQAAQVERLAAEAEQERRALDAALKAKDAEVDRLNTRLAAALRDNEKLGAVQRQLATADTERQRLAAELAQRELAASDLKKDLVRAQQAVAQGSVQLSDTREALRLMQDQLAARDQDLAASAQRSAVLEAQVADRTDALARQQREVARLEAELVEQRASLENQLATAKGEQEQLRQATQERQRRVDELEQKLLATQVTLVASERKAARLEEVEKKLEDEQNRVTQQEQELVKLRGQLDKERSRPAPAAASVVATQERGPVIEIIDPPLAATRGVPSVLLRSPVREVEVIGRVRPEEKLLTFKVNEKPTDVDAQGLFREQVSLREPKTSVNLVAVDQLGHRTALDFVIIPPAKGGKAARDTATASQSEASVDFGTYHALVIGNEQYANLPDLSTPANDARELAKVLRGRYGFKTRLLINASRYEILSALNELRAELTDQDNLLIYYAGHGELDNVNLRGHWLPVDAEAESSANWISNIAITDILNVMQAKHVMVIADSCYSGAMTRSGIARLETGLSPETKVKWYRTMSKARARAVLTSGGLKPVLDAGGGGHSIFTRALLDTLRGNQRILEGYALYREVQKRVKRAAAQLNVEQDPQYAPIKYAGHEAGEFFFLPNSAKVSQQYLRPAAIEIAAR